MIDARVGRLLAASLHQAIADELPQRLEFYEGWLRGQAMRDGTIGLAPITGVLGFLRTEGDAYHRSSAVPVVWRPTGRSRACRRCGGASSRPCRGPFGSARGSTS